MSSKIRCLLRYIFIRFLDFVDQNDQISELARGTGELCAKGFRGIWLAGTTAEATQEGGLFVAKKRGRWNALGQAISIWCFLRDVFWLQFVYHW